MIDELNPILATVARHAESLRDKGARRLSLFGSALRGPLRDDSDVDFLTDLEPKTFDTYMDVKEYLEDLLSRPIDLVIRDALKPEMRDHILREAIDVPGL